MPVNSTEANNIFNTNAQSPNKAANPFEMPPSQETYTNTFGGEQAIGEEPQAQDEMFVADPAPGPGHDSITLNVNEQFSQDDAPQMF